MSNRLFRTLLLAVLSGVFTINIVICQEHHGMTDREAIDKMRDRDLQPEKIMDAIRLVPGMIAGEAGSSYGYFTFKMGKRIGNSGKLYANDIDPSALRLIEERCKTEKITNISTVLGVEDDPFFPVKNLDMVVVFDCLFEFSQAQKWIENTRKYLKPGGRLVIVDPDQSKMGGSSHFINRKQITGFGLAAGYRPIEVDDSFLKSHMIIVLKTPE